MPRRRRRPAAAASEPAVPAVPATDPTRPRRRVWPIVVVVLAAGLGAAVGVGWWSQRSTGEVASAPTADAADDIALLAEPYPLIDTLAVPLEDSPDGRLVPGSTAVLEGSWVGVDVGGAVIIELTGTGSQAPGVVSAFPCGADGSGVATLAVEPGATTNQQVVAAAGSGGRVCLESTVEVNVVAEAIGLIGAFEPSAAADVTIDVLGAHAASIARPLIDPVRLVDTRPNGATTDGRFAATGVRWESSTLDVPLEGRVDVPASAVAAVIEVTASEPLDDGHLDLFPTEHGAGRNATLHYRAGGTTSTTTIVPLDTSGRICLANQGRTHVQLDVVGWLVDEPADVTATGDSDEPGEPCPQQALFPDRRLVAMYGTPRTPRLGVLGEQDAEAAAQRLAQIAAPYRAGDRPVLPAFELIATLATTDAGDDGKHRLRSEPEVVREYLDVARRHGYYLILDIQPGWSDFLTEARYYEEFLREPDVGLALDPEWRTRPPSPPAGGYVGQTDAEEVNAVIEWVAELVAEEDLPEKLLIVHQFQERMVLDRESLVEPPGVALTIHMDGFGSRAQKQHTWSLLRVDAPWNNGLKLFYDEDRDLYRPDEILDGAFEPIPDLITYQ